MLLRGHLRRVAGPARLAARLVDEHGAHLSGRDSHYSVPDPGISSIPIKPHRRQPISSSHVRGNHVNIPS